MKQKRSTTEKNSVIHINIEGAIADMIGQTIRAQSDVKRKCQCKEENVCKWDRFIARKHSRTDASTSSRIEIVKLLILW